MTNKTSRFLGLALVTATPSTVDEYEQLSGIPGSCLQSAIANELYRGVFADARAEFCDALEKETLLERKTRATGKKKKNEDGTEEDVLVYDESEAEYVKRVLVELAEKEGVAEVPVTRFQHLADALSVGGSNEIKFDPSRKERAAAGPKKLAKRFIEAAQSVLDAGRGSDWVAKYGGDGTLEAIAGKLKELQDAEDAKQKLSDKFL
jgi:hypothetical protein